MVLGLIPGLITGTLVAAALVALALSIDAIVGGLTGFADGWPSLAQDFLHVAVGIGVLWAAGLTAVYGFTSVTLLIGQPFFEAIVREVDDGIGAVPLAPERGWAVRVLGDVGERAARLALAAVTSVSLFVLGFIPVVGSAAAWVLGAWIGGWFLALDLTDAPFERRGLRLRDRRAALRLHKRVARGFGVGAFVIFLIPGGAILAMPAAVAGAVLLTRHALGEPTALATPPARHAASRPAHGGSLPPA